MKEKKRIKQVIQRPSLTISHKLTNTTNLWTTATLGRKTKPLFYCWVWNPMVQNILLYTLGLLSSPFQSSWKPPGCSRGAEMSRTKRKPVGSARFLQQQPILVCYQHYFNYKFRTQNYRGCGDERVNSIPARIITLSKRIGILSSLQYFEIPALKRNFCRKTAVVMCLISAVMTGDTSQNRIFCPVSIKCALVSFQPFRSSV